MFRIAIAIFALVAFQASALAQLYPYQWRIGVSAGYSTYHGDLSPFRINKFSEIGKVFRLYDFNPNYVPQASFGISIETQLNHTLGLSLKGGHYAFAMSDRFVDRSDNLKPNSPNFNRALNFKTEVTDVGLSLLFRSDNGRMLNKKALVAPYLGLGVGVLWFDVYGDLYHSNGQPYAHSDATMTDGEYETALRPLRTELSDGYGKASVYGELSLGIRFRLAHRWELFIQSDIKYTATDYLDDVSGKYRRFYTSAQQQYAANPTGLPENGGQNYRGNPNQANDLYLYHAAGIKFSFGHSKEAFRAPVVHPSSYQQPGFSSDIKALVLIKKPEKPAVIDASRAKQVELDPQMEDEVKSALNWIQHEFEILSIREEEREIEMQRDSLQLVVDRLELITDSLTFQSDSLSTTDSTAILHNALKIKMTAWEKQLDSLGALQRVIEESYVGVAAQKAQVDTAVVLVPETPVDSAVEVSIEIQPQPQATVDTTKAPQIKVAPAASDQAVLIQYLERQEKKDSIIIDRLTRLLEDKPLPPTQRSAPATSPEQSEQPELRSYPSQTSNAELESLRSEVNYLKELILEQNQIRSAPSSGTNLGVVVAPRSGSRDKKEDGAVDSSQLENLQMQMAAMQYELEELRKQNRLQKFEYEQSLKTQVPIEVAAPPVDSLPADTLVAPTPTETKTDSVVAPKTEVVPVQPKTPEPVAKPDPVVEPAPEKVEQPTTPKETAVTKKPEVIKTPAPTEPKEVNIYFNLNAMTPTSAEIEKIANAARHWKTDRTQRIKLKSFADNSGNADYNRRLCEKRNASVEQILVNQFDVAPSAIESSVGGPVERPNQSVYSPSDRRVEIHVGL